MNESLALKAKGDLITAANTTAAAKLAKNLKGPSQTEAATEAVEG